MVATFLAFGEFTNFFKFGFLTYWQRQVLCSFNLLQQIAEGTFAPVIAFAHGLNSNGLQVTASIVNSASSLRNKRTITQNAAAYDIFIIIFFWIIIIITQMTNKHRKENEYANW